tara:strand:- start:222 stop:560 length:339 start_codon:yes stop_codon:yes gene_type:complete
MKNQTNRKEKRYELIDNIIIFKKRNEYFKTEALNISKNGCSIMLTEEIKNNFKINDIFYFSFLDTFELNNIENTTISVQVVRETENTFGIQFNNQISTLNFLLDYLFSKIEE